MAMRLQELREVIENQQYDVADLCSLLELTVEDLLDRFPDKVVDNQSKFGVNETEAE
jgi:hypothetical protein